MSEAGARPCSVVLSNGMLEHRQFHLNMRHGPVGASPEKANEIIRGVEYLS